jgi:hypothetical protein
MGGVGIPQITFPPGGVTPVFNEINALLTMSPLRPDPAARFEDLTGPKERVRMKNVIDDDGIVQPSIFVRSPTFTDPQTGLKAQILGLAVCSGVAHSALLGGEVAVHVKNVGTMPGMTPEGLPPSALALLDRPLIGGRAVTPREASLGKIQSISPQRDFPARVTILVHYTFILGVRDGKLANVSDTVSVEGQEPHFMEATVNSIPPDPETPLVGRGWDLVTDSGGFLKAWTRIESFRFLGPGDWEHRLRVDYKPPQ